MLAPFTNKTLTDFVPTNKQSTPPKPAVIIGNRPAASGKEDALEAKESGPRIAIEAMSLGIPVVASNRGGIPEIVGEGGVLFDLPPALIKDNRLVPPPSVAIPWVEALARLISDPEEYEHFSNGALKQWSKFDSANQIGNFAQLLASLRE